jgi:lia operon protein LiaF
MNKININKLFWGILLIIIGLLFLFDNLEWMDFNFWDFLGTYWPLILIFIGVKNIIFHVTSKK